MASLSPETSDGFADRDVVFLGMTVDVARVIDFCDGCGVDQVDLAVCEGF